MGRRTVGSRLRGCGLGHRFARVGRLFKVFNRNFVCNIRGGQLSFDIQNRSLSLCALKKREKHKSYVVLVY